MSLKEYFKKEISQEEFQIHKIILRFNLFQILRWKQRTNLFAFLLLQTKPCLPDLTISVSLLYKTKHFLHRIYYNLAFEKMGQRGMTSQLCGFSIWKREFQAGARMIPLSSLLLTCISFYRSYFE